MTALDLDLARILTCALIGGFGDENGVLVLGPSVDVVDEVGPVVRVVDPLPAEGQLVVAAIFGSGFLDPGQPRVEPVRGARVVVDEVDLALLGVGLLPVGRQRPERVESVVGYIVGRVRVTRVSPVRPRTPGLRCTCAAARSLGAVT